MPDSESNGGDYQSPEYLALVEDLKAYDNPEVFFNPSVSLIYRLSVPNPVPGFASAITVEINRPNLLAILEEVLFWLLSISPDLEATLKTAEVDTIEQLRAKALATPEWPQVQAGFFWFFVRHFPEIMEKMVGFFAILATGSLSNSSMIEDPIQKLKNEKQIKSTIETGIKAFRVMLKRMLRTKTRGGKTPTLAPNLRESLHLAYDYFHTAAKTIKKHHDSLFRTYTSQHHRVDGWQVFWIEHASKVFSEHSKGFLELFAEVDHPSASEVAYRWLALSTGLKQSYVTNIVKELRRKARLASPQKPDIETK